VAVFANVILNYVSNTLHGNYSLGHWWALTLSWTAIVAGGLFACFKVSHIVNDLTTGSAHGGASGGIPLSSLLMRIF
jgi:hypothetical protein